MSNDPESPERGPRADSATTPNLLGLQRRVERTKRIAALGALAARLAHELGTPLHSISGHLDLMLADDALQGELRQRTDIVAGEVSRLSVMIRRYLTRLRPPAPEPKPTDLAALVVSVLRLLDPVLVRRNVDLELDLGEGTDAPIPCDPDQIEQVVLNLVQNAIDSMPQGGRLTIRTSTTTDGQSISVCDSGCGIRSGDAPHVFEPFFSTKGAGRGSGLGLSICREIAREHGGDVRLDSQPGTGTIVTLTLRPLGPRNHDA